MNLAVVGGYYHERCAEPHWDEFFGSGGRAAAAVSRRNVEIELFTFCSSEHDKSLAHFASTFGFKAFPTPSPSPVSFQYQHWLRPPTICPNRDFFRDTAPMKVPNRDGILRFGLYEGSAVVKGKRVVYDPQDGREARPFEENGSDAEELAIVCNYGEGQKLTGEKEPEKIITCLLGKLNVKAVVLKGAWEGSIVATSSNREQIKPIPTRQVHKIGSGDIFSAEFAYHWAALGADPIEAAREANRRVAYYCERATLPIPADFSLPATPIPDLAVAGKAYDIYLAAPFFSAGQLAVVEEVRDLFSQRGATTFSPYHDVGLGNAAKVAAKDLAGIRASKFVFACLDGYDPGTVFEVGYARALNIPVIVYSPNLTQANETMFVGSGCEIIRDFTTAVYRAIWWLQSR